MLSGDACVMIELHHILCCRLGADHIVFIKVEKTGGNNGYIIDGKHLQPHGIIGPTEISREYVLCSGARASVASPAGG